MTAEIALLNKLAVTLAADSAVTLSVGGSQKVYNSADKIFEATNHDPIGLMVYNNPEFQGIPIEAIVKLYRDTVCHDHYDTVFSFAEAFLKHLETVDAPDVTVAGSIYSAILPRISSLRRLYSEATNRVISNIAELAGEEQSADGLVAKIDAEIISALDAELEHLTSMVEQPWADGLNDTDVANAHQATINEIVNGVFLDVKLTSAAFERIHKIASMALLKEYQPNQLTGLVFAGFGSKEIFPSLIAYEVFGVVSGRLKYRQTGKFDVDRKLEPEATVMPFAQQEMVDRFIYGIDNQFLELSDSYFSGALSSLKDNVLSVASMLEPETSDALTEAVNSSVDSIMNEFRMKLVPDHITTSRAQLSDIIRSMPKQELAALSESLVQITSLKRKFSAEAESVGGPIDVAMITRAEGFVWVKRKHFFEPTLNPRYFYRRYGKHRAPISEGNTEP